eukprot:CAMPEP_0179332488 /NCGR_PEP_ID=MMETSP0797-20121207/64761_1 /TAXON_ID=47934 /ORGANISM="Dinophysis acuminata, Strain DAEP01" /LENGTH=35 /DNA_ID= /DNA_START= /DNA_END= /DNA_ORIENTATION=
MCCRIDTIQSSTASRPAASFEVQAHANGKGLNESL